VRAYDGSAQYRDPSLGGETDWTCFLAPSNRETVADGAVKPELRAQERYKGSLYVITDAEVASGGETLTALSAQVDGAVVVGENTMGCSTYGNVDRVAVLPNSRLMVQFGRTKFVPAGRPFVENLGYFPDYWLDTADPLAAIAERVGEVEGVRKIGLVNPHVVATSPANGAERVDPRTSEVRITFDTRMSELGMAIFGAEGGEAFDIGEFSWSEDRTTLVLKNIKLKPGTRYVMWINHGKWQALRSERGLLSVPFKYEFTTGRMRK
jgi:hypothetical protein